MTCSFHLNIVLICALILCCCQTSHSQIGAENIITYNKNARSVSSADIDDDGDNDLVVAYSNDNGVVWYENLGNDEFSEAVIISSSALAAWSVHVIDLDGDGDQDVLSASRLDDKIAWYENLGEGVFSSELIISNSAQAARSVTSADIDGDGDPDVLSASFSDDKIAWYENMGDGQFSSEIIISSDANGAESVFAADLDGDGDQDVLSASSNDDKVAWYENLGNGEFTAEFVLTTSAENASYVYASDLDGDGDIDAMSASHGDDTIAWYENLGNGTFSDEIIVSMSANGARAVVATDLDGDGDNDLISASEHDNKIAWYQNLGSGEFLEEVVISATAHGAVSIFPSDINGDGNLDIISASQFDDKIAWYKNLGLGEFLAENIVSAGANAPQSVHAADLDGDGDTDVLSASSQDDKIAWYENLGDGEFSVEKVISSTAKFAAQVYAADLNGDGDMDIISVSPGDDMIAWHENLGDGEFTSQQIITTSAEYVVSVDAIDLDGDGDSDLISASRFDDKIAWYENLGDGNFSGEIVIDDDLSDAISVFAADMDDDGDNDLVSASAFEDKIVWYQNDGLGSFSDQNVISFSVETPYSVFCADLDNDGDIDVVAAAEGINAVVWMENMGNGMFALEEVITLDANSVRSVFAADLDNDGKVDVLSASVQDDKVAWYKNLGNGIFSSQIIISTSALQANSVFAADLDGDGDLEVLSASLQDNKIAWYENFHGEGCSDPAACNYDPDAWIDGGNCCYGVCGCTDTEADNYSGLAECDDGSCIYKLIGCVFYDEDEDGVWDDDEYGLPNQQVLTLFNGWVSFTNDEGAFSVAGLSQGFYQSQVIPNDVFPYVTTLNPLSFEVSSGPIPKLIFGVSNEQPDFAVCVDFYPPGGGYPCNDWVNHNICYRNEGNVPIDGIVEVEYNTLFQDYQEVTPIDSVVDNYIYMSFENLLPGQMFFYDVMFLTPTVDFIGEMVTSSSRVYGFFEGDQVAYGEQELTVEMTCSYDPNDKQVFPSGYEEPHFILDETQLEYLIRFQNTGNAPATNVLVTDTIDENLNLETFQLMANSHSVMTTIRPEERVIEFLFEEIMLPDSTSNEPESHGMISYFITPYPELAPATVLNNTGNIYFDNNPPIITNTTWNTIYECTQELATISGQTIYCEGDELNLANNQDYIETYVWSIETDVIGLEAELDAIVEESGMVEVALEVENPLCLATDTITILINEIPDLIVTGGADICPGDTVSIIASSEFFVEWLGLGTDSVQVVSPDETTSYLATAVNGFDCMNAQEVTIVVNPQPEAYAGGDVVLCMGDSTILVATGGTIYDWSGLGTEPELAVSPEETTSYEVIVTNEFNCIDTDEVTVEVVAFPEASFTLNGNTLTAPDGFFYQWFLNGNPIDGATNQTYEVTEDGNYSVEVTNEWDCSSLSDEEFIVYTGIDSHIRTSANLQIQLFPNPTSGNLTIQVPGNNGSLQFTLYDQSGREVDSFVMVGESMMRDVSELATGVYELRAIGSNGESAEMRLMIK